MSTNFAAFPGEICTVLTQTAKPGKAEELVAELNLLKASADSAAEPGTLQFDILRAGDKFCVVEKYANAAAIYAHTNRPPYKNLKLKIGDLVVEGSTSLTFWEPAESAEVPVGSGSHLH
ncbi:hypothetical protein CALCODRAFT_479694 [Calocera cornea HHB12733]|uniref:ABM domain-containing protein n=1 Tax=Calocera cornea HHB12733 TaxID=1353952 RepID=A0A165JCF2_9BASI|nr:hypothetical protein CALCODRAFT_479694 [Calocera cornea HHB12733]